MTPVPQAHVDARCRFRAGPAAAGRRRNSRWSRRPSPAEPSPAHEPVADRRPRTGRSPVLGPGGEHVRRLERGLATGTYRQAPASWQGRPTGCCSDRGAAPEGVEPASAPKEVRMPGSTTASTAGFVAPGNRRLQARAKAEEVGLRRRLIHRQQPEARRLAAPLLADARPDCSGRAERDPGRTQPSPAGGPAQSTCDPGAYS